MLPRFVERMRGRGRRGDAKEKARWDGEGAEGGREEERGRDGVKVDTRALGRIVLETPHPQRTTWQFR
jgi:hypothetical protein